MADDAAAPTHTDSSQVSDPYVIYQLRKPSQRGTAVIPRFVPNTHAPAFSPANYRFARVWTAHDNTVVSPSALLHVPRSFEYAGSLGSESSLWSDTASWVSVSSLRTTPSEPRAPLLHSNHTPVSAASFFNSDLENHRLRSSFRASSHLSDIDSPIPNDFRYPPALSESLSEDAVIDDLLSLRKPQFPQIRNHSSLHNSRDTSAVHRQSSYRNSRSSQHRSTPRSNPNRNSLIPPLTRKRRTLWQWLFCTNKAAMSTTVPSVTISKTATAVRRRIQPVNSAPNARTQRPRSENPTNQSSTTPRSKDRVPNADKDFLNRTQTAPDAPTTKNKASRRRHPSFEIRKGRPSGSTRSGRSMSWNFMSRGFLGRDKNLPKEPKEKKKRKSKAKDKPRQVPPEEPKEPRRFHRLVFKRSSSRKAKNSNKDAPKSTKRSAPAHAQKSLNVRPRKESHKTVNIKKGLTAEDRPREDRPRKSTKQLLEPVTGGGAPLPKSVVPSLREKQTNGKGSQTQRMRSTGSSEPVTSRISSDLSSTSYGRTNESDSSRSASNRLRQKYRPPTHELDPAAQGVSSDVSSHVSGGVGRTSPQVKTPDPNGDSAFLPSPDIRGVDPKILFRDSPHRAPLFAYPSTSSGSGGFSESTAWENNLSEYPDYTPAFGNFSSTAPELIAMMDPVTRAKEKNRARSIGGPLSYLMKQHDIDGDVNTESSGLTSLADESVSTHKTFSVTGEEYLFRSQLSGGFEGRTHGKAMNHMKTQETEQMQTAGGTESKRPIFQSYPMHPSQAKSPSHASSGASPRRFHSDWSDPHATDIDVYCQCNCSCVYEEECRRTCELIYGRSPSASSTRSRYGYQGFTTLPPAIQGNGRPKKMGSVDLYDNIGQEPFPTGKGGNGDHRQSTQKTYFRANGVDEIGDSEVERFLSEANGGRMGTTNVVGMHSSRNKNAVSGKGEARTKRSSRGRYNVEKSGRNDESSDRPRVRSSKAQHHTRDGKRRSSSKRTGQHRKQTDSEGSDRQQKGRTDVRVERSSKTRADGTRENVENEVGEEWQGSRKERGQQMGNSYVVKRSGLPPSSQAHTGQAHYASKEMQHETRRSQGEEMNMIGVEPVVELEYENTNGLVQIGQKGEVNKVKSRSKVEHRRRTTNGKEGEVRPRSRQTSKHSSRSRTPIFGVF